MKEATDRVCFAAEARDTENEGGDRSTKYLWPCVGQLCADLVVGQVQVQGVCKSTLVSLALVDDLPPSYCNPPNSHLGDYLKVSSITFTLLLSVAAIYIRRQSNGNRTWREGAANHAPAVHFPRLPFTTRILPLPVHIRTYIHAQTVPLFTY